MREVARIQGFSDCNKFHGTRAEMLKQVSNTVPHLLGQALGAQIRKAVAEGAKLRDSALPRDKKTEKFVARSDKRNRIDDHQLFSSIEFTISNYCSIVSLMKILFQLQFDKAHPKEDQAFVFWVGQVTEDF